MQKLIEIEHDLADVVGVREINEKYMTHRILAMRDQTQWLNDRGLRQTLLYKNLSASLRATLGEPRPIRHAKAFAYHLDHVDQPVFPEDQLAGSITGMWPVDEVRNNLPYETFRAEAIQALEEYLQCVRHQKPAPYRIRGTEIGRASCRERV